MSELTPNLLRRRRLRSLSDAARRCLLSGFGSFSAVIGPFGSVETCAGSAGECKAKRAESVIKSRGAGSPSPVPGTSYGESLPKTVPQENLSCRQPGNESANRIDQHARI